MGPLLPYFRECERNYALCSVHKVGYGKRGLGWVSGRGGSEGLGRFLGLGVGRVFLGGRLGGWGCEGFFLTRVGGEERLGGIA